MPTMVASSWFDMYWSAKKKKLGFATDLYRVSWNN